MKKNNRDFGTNLSHSESLLDAACNSAINESKAGAHISGVGFYNCGEAAYLRLGRQCSCAKTVVVRFIKC